jgi:molybdopterin synthase sulfur carrier subunit
MAVEVTVRLLGVFRGLSGKSQISLRLGKSTIKDAIRSLSKSFPPEARKLLVGSGFDDPRLNALILLNGKEINVLEGLETKIHEGDEITLIPIAHGG